jgi:hypothetical protein
MLQAPHDTTRACAAAPARPTRLTHARTAVVLPAALVAWRNRWATGLRLLAPLLFLAMALMVQEVMDMNARRTGRTQDVGMTVPANISNIPPCSSELFIYDKPCVDFVYTPNNNPRVKVRG